MSSLPGYTLEDYLAWFYDLIVEDQSEANFSRGVAELIGSVKPRKVLTKEQYVRLVTIFESYREQVENRLSDFDEENQSWRMYQDSAFDFIDEADIDKGNALIKEFSDEVLYPVTTRPVLDMSSTLQPFFDTSSITLSACTGIHHETMVTPLRIKEEINKTINWVQWNIPPDHEMSPLFGRDCKDHPNVRGTSYDEIFDLLGSLGCSKVQPFWTWCVLGIIETYHGKLVVSPGDWIGTLVPGVFVVMTNTEYQNYQDKLKGMF